MLFRRGDGYSFAKCNRLPARAAILATIDYGMGEAREEVPDIALEQRANADLTVAGTLYTNILGTIEKLSS